MYTTVFYSFWQRSFIYVPSRAVSTTPPRVFICLNLSSLKYLSSAVTEMSALHDNIVIDSKWWLTGETAERWCVILWETWMLKLMECFVINSTKWLTDTTTHAKIPTGSCQVERSPNNVYCEKRVQLWPKVAFESAERCCCRHLLQNTTFHCSWPQSAVWQRCCLSVSSHSACCWRAGDPASGPTQRFVPNTNTFYPKDVTPLSLSAERRSSRPTGFRWLWVHGAGRNTRAGRWERCSAAPPHSRWAAPTTWPAARHSKVSGVWCQSPWLR